jgi:hypothetical protein
MQLWAVIVWKYSNKKLCSHLYIKELLIKGFVENSFIWNILNTKRECYLSLIENF